MNEDFRSAPSDSPEGRGKARAVWDAYVGGVRWAVEPTAKRVARAYTMELVGFWVCWHLYGGFEGVQDAFGMHPSTIWRKVARFRKTFGAHPDEYVFPGIEIDTVSFWKAAAAPETDAYRAHVAKQAAKRAVRSPRKAKG
jgi:hypothetical protein